MIKPKGKQGKPFGLSPVETDYVDKEEIEVLEYKGVDIVTTANLFEGTATSNTNTTLLDSTAEWGVDEWTDKVIRLVSVDLAEGYCLIKSNTSDTLVFDCESEGLNIANYQILETFYADEPQSVYAFDIRNAYGALVMPNVSDRKERSVYKIYNELANNGDYKTIVMCRGANRARGNKYITLDHRHEGVDFYVHYFGVDHYDILNIDAVKRYASIRVNTSLPVGSDTYSNVMTFTSINHLDSKRFISKNVSNIYWLKYKSVVTYKMLLTGALSVQRSGVGLASIVSVTARVNRGGTLIDYESSEAIVRLPNNDIKAVPISIFLELVKDDEITIIAKRVNGTISILDGSTFTILEV